MMMLSRRNTRTTRSLKTRALRFLGFFLVLVVSIVSVYNQNIAISLQDSLASVAGKLETTTGSLSLLNYFASKQILTEENASLRRIVANYERTQQELSLSQNSLQSLCTLVNVPVTNLQNASHVNAAKVLTVQPMDTFGTIVGYDMYIFGTVLAHFDSASLPPQVKDLALLDNGSVLGTVVSVGKSSAVIELLSAPKHETFARIGLSAPVLFVGHGAHTLEAQISQELSVRSGDIVTLPGTSLPIGEVFEVVATPESATQTIRLRPRGNPSLASVIRFIRYVE